MGPFPLFMGAIGAVLMWGYIDYLLFTKRIDRRIKRELALQKRIAAYNKKKQGL
jgi:hypothetical protein